MNELLTVSEVSERLKLAERRGITEQSAARWLRRYLKRRQDVSGKRILVLVGEGASRPTYRVDMEQLEVACPELFSTRSELARALKTCALVGQRELRAQTEAIEDLDERLTVIANLLRKRGRAR